MTFSTRSSVSGTGFLLSPARRKIPAHAFFDKENLEWIDAAGSSTDDKEQTTASLGQSEVLSVENSPGSGSFRPSSTTSVRPSLPCWEKSDVFTDEGREEVAEGVSFVGEDAWDVLPKSKSCWLSLFSSDGIDGIEQLHEGLRE